MAEINIGRGYRLRRPEEGQPRVIAPDGEELPGSARTIDIAIDTMDRHLAAVRTKVRRCLCCGRDFTSTHVGNRMCRRCRNQPEGMV